MLDSAPISLLIPFVFLVGMCMGSFVSMASYRLPLGQGIIGGPSYCTQCRTPIKMLSLIPLFSWLWQRGRCGSCGSKISIRYPLIELSLGIVFTGLGLYYGISVPFVLMALLATELAILIVTDFEHYIIPDSIQIAVLITGIVWRIYHDEGIEDILPGMMGGLIIGLTLHYGYLYLRKKDALGWGDVKFLCVAGSWLPLIGFVPFLFLSGVIGTLTGLLWRLLGNGPVFPFGPALALSLFINIVFPDLFQMLQMIIR